MQHNPFFGSKQILVLDEAPKTSNDRTWCFWETTPGLFEPIVHHRWQKLHFYSTAFSSPINIAPYVYKMIRGIDFYQHVLQKAQGQPNVHFQTAKILGIGNEDGLGYVLTEDGKLYASYVFNSIMPSLLQAGNNRLQNLCEPTGPRKRQAGEGASLLQHFKGWLIETPENIFDDTAATFMDFRVSQQKATTFVYVLPVAPNKALVEFTLVSAQVLQQHEYNQGLASYINNYVTKGSYTVLEEEFGVIPMTDFHFDAGKGRVVNIGTAGGQTKASSGFTFQFIQKHSATMVQLLASGQHPLVHKSVFANRFHLYDSILLHILQNGKMQGADIFARMFKKIHPKTILRFLDNESNLVEELGIMASMPARIFLPVAVQVATN